MPKPKQISRPVPNSKKNDILSYYVYYKDKPKGTMLGGTLHTLGGQFLNHMTGVNFAEKAKREILELRSENDFLRKEVELLQDRVCDFIKDKYRLED